MVVNYSRPNFVRMQSMRTTQQLRVPVSVGAVDVVGLVRAHLLRDRRPVLVQHRARRYGGVVSAEMLRWAAPVPGAGVRACRGRNNNVSTNSQAGASARVRSFHFIYEPETVLVKSSNSVHPDAPGKPMIGFAVESTQVSRRRSLLRATHCVKQQG